MQPLLLLTVGKQHPAMPLLVVERTTRMATMTLDPTVQTSYRNASRRGGGLRSQVTTSLLTVGGIMDCGQSMQPILGIMLITGGGSPRILVEER